MTVAHLSFDNWSAYSDLRQPTVAPLLVHSAAVQTTWPRPWSREPPSGEMYDAGSRDMVHGRSNHRSDVLKIRFKLEEDPA
jgi:hypothetical protein